jgi:small subunit ribosomal protein S9
VTENPEDEPRTEDEPAAAAQPGGEEQQPASEAPPEPEPALPEQVPALQEPQASEQQEPQASEQQEPQASEQQEPRATPAPATPAAEPGASPVAATGSAPQAGIEAPLASAEEDLDVSPRQKPEIPGADLEPDIVPDAGQFLDAEALAAAEAEAEAAAARAQEESEDGEAQPIADAAIDLAAGARYTATGKRKTAVARVILKPGTGSYSINDKPLDAFFPRETLQRMIRQPLEAVGYESRMDVVARMHGGGVSAQAGALRHGVSRALIEADPNLRGELKRRGFLTRDPRVKERKKAGLKKARKRPQFSKR